MTKNAVTAAVVRNDHPEIHTNPILAPLVMMRPIAVAKKGEKRNDVVNENEEKQKKKNAKSRHRRPSGKVTEFV